MVELRTVDPRTLIDNPDNPRRKAPADEADRQMEATARAVGILQPPVTREVPKGLMTQYGHRRVRGAIAAGLPMIQVLVLGADDDVEDDRLRALIENVARKAMSPVDQWRAIEKLVSERWTEEAISTALTLPVRTIRKLRLLANLHPPMLDRMHQGDMPGEGHLRNIASATQDEQAAAWKRCKPKKAERADWGGIASQLARRRMKASDAAFTQDFADAYGVTYEEDLFAPAGEDSRTTTNVDGFLAAQQAWIEDHLPENGVVLRPDGYNDPKLPPGAQRYYGPRGAGHEKVGFCLDEGTGRIEEVRFTVAAPIAREDGASSAPEETAKPRADVTQKGVAMIGNMRTDALHAALRDEPIDDAGLIALLVLALAGNNVEVKTGAGDGARAYGARARIAQPLIEGGAITSDPAVLRSVARAMLEHTLSCRENWSQSGMVARIAGDAIDADAHLPSMATQEFFTCLSKKAMERVALSLNVPVQPTGKATRRDVISKVNGKRWIYPAAAFTLVAEERDVDSGDEDRPDDGLLATGDEHGEEAENDGADAEPEDDGTDRVMPPAASPVQPGPEARAAA